MRVEQHSGKGWAPGTGVIAANGANGAPDGVLEITVGL
jgi:hypothetical protein